MPTMNIKGAYAGEIRIQMNRLDRPEVMTQAGPNELYRCILEFDPDVVVEDAGGQTYHIQPESIYVPLVGEDGEDYKEQMWTFPEILKAVATAGAEGGTKIKVKHGIGDPGIGTVTTTIT
jgi:hypothetical protein